MNAASRVSQIFLFLFFSSQAVVIYLFTDKTFFNFKSSDFKFQIMIYFTK